MITMKRLKRDYGQTGYTLTVLFLAMTAAVANGCASTGPEKGSLEYQRKQVVSCKMLCAGGDVAIAEIEGLECACNKSQQNSTPVINNVFYPSASNSTSVAPSAPMSVNVTANGGSSEVKENSKPTFKGNGGVEVTDSTGRQIISRAINKAD